MAAVLSPGIDQAVQQDDYLGPAMVVGLDGPVLHVEMPGGPVVAAQPAFVVAYAPAPGDVLLVIARGGACYAIGVLRGAGRTVLSLAGDVEIRAEGGALRLWGERGVEVSGPEVSMQADRLRIIAGAVTQKFSSLVQRVRELASFRARETHTVVDEGAFTKAKSATILTEETMTLNGKQIHLG